MIYLRLLKSLQKTLRERAEKIAALMAEYYLAERTSGGSRAKFEAALAHVNDIPPEPYDRLDTN
jgi:hypothetical protein